MGIRNIDREIILELTSRNIQRAFKEYGLGPRDAAEALHVLREEAFKLMQRGGSDYHKGVNLLKFFYDKMEAFWKHVEGTKIDLTERQKVDELSGEELEQLFQDVVGEI